VQAYNPNKTQKGAYLATDPATDTKFETFSPDLVSSSNGNPTAMPGGSDFFRWID
jgi:hypothetical protein